MGCRRNDENQFDFFTSATVAFAEENILATLFFSFFSHTQTLNKNLFVYFWPIHTAGCISQYKITTITFRATLYDRAQFTVQFAVVKPVGYFWPLRQHRPAPPGYVPLMVGIFIVTLLRVPIIVHLGYPSELITLFPPYILVLIRLKSGPKLLRAAAPSLR